jgi:DNA-binding beta-propeller fold protein YncE
MTRREFLPAAAVAAVSAQPRPGPFLMYAGSFPGQVIVFDEALEKVVDRIPITTGIPRGLSLSYDKKKIYVSTTRTTLEVIDIVTRKVINQVKLDEGNRLARVRGGFAPDPEDKLIYTMVGWAVKQPDRFEIEKPKFAVIDLDQRKIVRTAEFPRDEPRLGFGDNLRVSPDGKFLYVFSDSVLIFNTSDFKLAEKIELANPPFPGMINVGLGWRDDPAEDRGILTGIFNSTDPIVRRTIFGIARFDLTKRTFDFTPVGPSANAGVGGLQLAPDKKTGYTVVYQGDHGNRRVEFWVFDMTTRQVTRRVEFDGPINFRFTVSGDGRGIYVYGSSPLVEIYDASTLRPRKSLTLDVDLTSNFLVLPARI